MDHSRQPADFFARSDKSFTSTVDGLSDWRHQWYTWGFNYSFHDDPKQIVIFTPAYGPVTGMPYGSNVVVRRAKMVSVQQGNTAIAPDGSDVTVNQLAPLLRQLGLENAMCLDDAASADLYYEGRYLVTLGRKLNDALAQVYDADPVSRLRVDGRYVFADRPPLIENGVTMVPVRGIADALGAAVTIDGADPTVEVKAGAPTSCLPRAAGGLWSTGPGSCCAGRPR